MEFELLNILGKEASSPEVRDAVKKHGLLDIRKSPGRIYQGSKKTGVDLIIEHGQVTGILVFVQPDPPTAAFSGTLPFGIRKGMSQQGVHQAVGKPTESSEFSSKYEMPKIKAKVVVRYDGALVVDVLSIAYKD